MKKLTLVMLALAGFGTSGAHAAQGFYDSYGYQMPGKYSSASKPSQGSLFGSSKPAKKSVSAPQVQKKKSAKASGGGGQMSGGSRPSIAPSAPPKVAFSNGYGAGSIVIDQAGRKLYYVLSSSQAYAYPIAVGKDGFRWSGTQKISKEVDWPDWRPPAEMRQRKPDLPEHMTGGIRNPLGAKALYLGNSLYRIHGTNDAKSIGTAASSGCIRMHNGHVVHLASLASVGTTVHVLNKLPKNVASN